VNDNRFLIPANSKKSMLYLNLFNKTDAFIFGGGFLGTITLLLLNFGTSSLKGILFVLSPLLICAFLVIPLPNVHNIRTFMKIVFVYFTNPREYHWKGWCVDYGKETDKLQ